MYPLKMLIDGKLVGGASTLDVLNPATEQVIASCARADEAQLNQAVAAAKAAFPAWSSRPLAERAKLILELADAMEKEIDDFGHLITEEQGRPLPHAAFEVVLGVGTLRGIAAMDLPTKVLRETDEVQVLEQRLPLGVVAAITPWNGPIILLMQKVAPALLAGNTMVVKPSPTTPLSTLKFGELCARILPPGVLNIIVDQNDLGEALTTHPDVAKISFTGSNATGKKVMRAAAGTLKRLTLELGGNDAAIVLDDIAPAEAAQKVFDAAMINAGQICMAAKRAYVPEDMYDEFVNALVDLADNHVVDDGLAQGAQMGPLQNRAQYEKVKNYLEDAHRDGKVVAGGAAMDRPGYFIRPTIVRDIDENSPLVREEQFGPVLPVLKYSDLDEVIARANDSEYGLGGTVWTGDPERGLEVAKRINSGLVWVNQHMMLPVDLPVGGAKQSGIGAENGLEGLLEYTQRKIINVLRA